MNKAFWLLVTALTINLASIGEASRTALQEQKSDGQSAATEKPEEEQSKLTLPRLATEPSSSQTAPQSPEVNFPSPAEQIQKRKKKPFSFRVSANGYASLQYQVGSAIQGTEQGRQTFRSENFGLSKGFNAFGSLRMDWEIGKLRLQGEYTPFSYSPTANRFRAEYLTGSTKFTYGNLFLSLQGNQFVTLSRYAQGGQMEHRFGRGSDLTLVTFQTPSQVVTDVFQGNSSPGPYFLRRSPIIDGSEQVRLDERPLRRGVDYTIDYSYGMINFATPIPVTSTIAVSYETVGFGGGVGRFVGARANLRTGEGSRLGVTFLAQQVPFTVQAGVRKLREEFRGDGTVGPFLLQIRPVAPLSERVYVEGLLQVRDVHYRINYNEGIVTFLQPVRVGALVTIEYEQAAGAAAQVGTLRLLGLDWNATFKNIGRLSFQFGQSSGGDRSGQAMEVHLGNETQRFAYSLRWRRITSGFSRIENTDFFRNDAGLFADLRYEIFQGLSLTAQWQNSRSAGGRFFGIGLAGIGGTAESRNRDLSIQFTFERPKLPRLQLSHQRMSSGFSGAGTFSDSNKTFTTAYLGYQLGHWSLEGAWERANDRFEPYGHGQGDQQTLTSNFASTGRRRISLAFRPGSKFSAMLDWTRNESDGSQQYRSDATQRVLTLSYMPWESLQLSFSHHKLSGASTISSLLIGNVLTGAAGGTLSGLGGYYGGYGTVGFGTGYGAGFGGYGTFGVGTRPTFGGYGSYGTSGYSGWGGTQSDWGTSPYGSQKSGWVTAPDWGTPSGRLLHRQLPGHLLPPTQTPTLRTTGNESTYTTFGVNWNPLKRLFLTLDWSTNADKGSDFVSPSRQRNLGLTGAYQLSNKLSLFAQFNLDRTSYFDQLNESLTLMGSVGLNWGDYNRLGGSLSYQRIRMQNLRLVGKVPNLEETNYNALAATFQAPIAKRLMFRARAAWLQNSGARGVFGGRYRNTETEAILEYRITRNIGFGINWTRTKRKGDRPEQDYSASILRAHLIASF